jgi:hypothetical protein
VVTALVPLPKFHAYWVIGAPAGATDALALKVPMKPHLLWITTARAVNEAVKGPVTTVVNVAVTDSAALIVIVHAPVPVHAPLQPPNVEPLPAVAVSVTLVPWL